MAISLGEWTRLIETEYLGDFIAQGGAAVKFTVASDAEGVSRTLATVGGAAVEAGYLVAWVDAAATKVQAIEQIFFAVARQVDWEAVTERWLRDRFAENGYRVAPEQSLTGNLDAIAEANDTTRQQLLAETRRWLTTGLMRDNRLAREFRTALTMLCQAQLNPQNVAPSDASVVMQFLRGEPCSLTALKRLQIYQKIGRHNARLMLSSLSTFLPRVGYHGLVLLMDIRPVVSDSPSAENTLRYTRGAVQDTYEVLRQFVDDTDELEHLLLIVSAGPGLLDNERRGLDSYSALKMRTSDEVRDRSRANPLGGLVRLDTAETPDAATTDEAGVL